MHGSADRYQIVSVHLNSNELVKHSFFISSMAKARANPVLLENRQFTTKTVSHNSRFYTEDEVNRRQAYPTFHIES